jgi:hypothetical protein
MRWGAGTQKLLVTPPGLALAEGVNVEDLYVGDAELAQYERWFLAAVQWANAWGAEPDEEKEGADDNTGR